MIWGYHYFRNHPYTPLKITGWSTILMELDGKSFSFQFMGGLYWFVGSMLIFQGVAIIFHKPLYIYIIYIYIRIPVLSKQYTSPKVWGTKNAGILNLISSFSGYFGGKVLQYPYIVYIMVFRIPPCGWYQRNVWDSHALVVSIFNRYFSWPFRHPRIIFAHQNCNQM